MQVHAPLTTSRRKAAAKTADKPLTASQRRKAERILEVGRRAVAQARERGSYLADGPRELAWDRDGLPV